MNISKELACQVLAKQLAQQLPDSMAVPWTLNNESATAYLAKGNAKQIIF